MAKPKTTTDKIADIVAYLESMAEDENYPRMIHIYQQLADIVTKAADEEVALKVMKEVKKRLGWIR